MGVSGWKARVSQALLAIAMVSLEVPGAAQAAASAAVSLNTAKQALAAKQYGRAKEEFKAYLAAHAGDVNAELGLADAELGLHEYEAAELDYRRVVAAQPQLWIAHKNLVIVEAALGRWSEFERERAVLRGARERDAPGISARESDVIDGFEVHGQRWLVREYFVPVGRSETRYNFERFSSEGRVEEFISLEPTAAAQAALKPGDVRIGQDGQRAIAKDEFSLNWYTGKAHGTVKRYPKGEPSYEQVRADVLQWLRKAR